MHQSSGTAGTPPASVSVLGAWSLTQMATLGGGTRGAEESGGPVCARLSRHLAAEPIPGQVARVQSAKPSALDTKGRRVLAQAHRTQACLHPQTDLSALVCREDTVAVCKDSWTQVQHSAAPVRCRLVMIGPRGVQHPASRFAVTGRKAKSGSAATAWDGVQFGTHSVPCTCVVSRVLDCAFPA